MFVFVGSRKSTGYHSVTEALWGFKMADHMDQEQSGTSEEFLPGIGELKTFSQVRRPEL